MDVPRPLTHSFKSKTSAKVIGKSLDKTHDYKWIYLYC